MPVTDYDSESFGKRVRRLRKERGMTQKQLCGLINSMDVEMSQPFLSQLENDKYIAVGNIGARRALALCMALNVTTDYLYYEKEDNKSLAG